MTFLASVLMEHDYDECWIDNTSMPQMYGEMSCYYDLIDVDTRSIADRNGRQVSCRGKA